MNVIDFLVDLFNPESWFSPTKYLKVQMEDLDGNDLSIKCVEFDLEIELNLNHEEYSLTLSYCHDKQTAIILDHDKDGYPIPRLTYEDCLDRDGRLDWRRFKIKSSFQLGKFFARCANQE